MMTSFAPLDPLVRVKWIHLILPRTRTKMSGSLGTMEEGCWGGRSHQNDSHVPKEAYAPASPIPALDTKLLVASKVTQSNSAAVGFANISKLLCEYQMSIMSISLILI